LLWDETRTLVEAVHTIIADMANDPTAVIELLYDLLEQQPISVYVWERIIEAWDARNERGTLPTYGAQEASGENRDPC
jgi:hypothetical protein